MPRGWRGATPRGAGFEPARPDATPGGGGPAPLTTTRDRALVGCEDEEARVTTLLVLGGTRFVGRAVVAEALARGWEVTTFNRGTRAAPSGVEQLEGDRRATDGLDALAGRRWDLAIDTWSDAAVVVHQAVTALTGQVRRLAYVSSRSVYAMPTPAGADETTPTVLGNPAGGRDEDYAHRKAGSEVAAAAAFPDVLLLRAGLILGPWEDVGRLPWWLDRIAAGGRVPAPGPADLPLQYVDVRDLATFALDGLAHGLSGPHDVVSRPGHATIGEVLSTCRDVTGSDADLAWLTPAQVTTADVDAWTDLPLWLPPGDLHDSLYGSDPSRALAAGLAPRPIVDTVADTWTWLQDPDREPLPVPRPDRPVHGLTTAQESALLATLDRA